MGVGRENGGEDVEDEIDSRGSQNGEYMKSGI